MTDDLRPIGGVTPGPAGDYRFADGSAVVRAEFSEGWWAVDTKGWQMHSGALALDPQTAAHWLAEKGMGPAYIDTPGDLDAVRPKPRPLADRARDAAGNASGPTAALILELLGEVDALVGAAIEHHPAMDLAGCRLPEKWRAVIMSRPYGENTICMSTEAFGTHAEAVAAVRKAAGLTD